MAMENAQKFLKKIVEDKALQERLAGKGPGEVLAAAKELGLECTQEELEKAAECRELNPDEMADTAAGVNYNDIKKLVTDKLGKLTTCSNPAGHQWVYTHHVEEDKSFLGISFGTTGYNCFECAHCHQTMKKHVTQSDY